MAIELGLAGMGLGIVSGIMQADAAEDQARAQAAAQYQAELDQQNAANFRGVMSTYQQNRAIAQKNAARRFRNMVIAKNANAQRAFAELTLARNQNKQFGNVANTYKHTMAGINSNLSGRGMSRGGTAKAIKNMMRGRNANEIIAIAENGRLQEKAILNQQQAALAQRDFSRDEAALFIPGAGPTYQYAGSGVSMMGSILSGAAQGLQMGAQLSSLGGGTPTDLGTDPMVGTGFAGQVPQVPQNIPFTGDMSSYPGSTLSNYGG